MARKEEKTVVNDIDRSFYDFRFEEKEDEIFKVNEGLSEDIVLEISKEKGDPDWMRDFRLKCLKVYNETAFPQWGPSIEGLNMNDIVTYIRPKEKKMAAKWDDLPEDIQKTFVNLGIPKAERESLAGVGAQYDSELVYHNVKDHIIK